MWRFTAHIDINLFGLWRLFTLKGTTHSLSPLWYTGTSRACPLPWLWP